MCENSFIKYTVKDITLTWIANEKIYWEIFPAKFHTENCLRWKQKKTIEQSLNNFSNERLVCTHFLCMNDNSEIYLHTHLSCSFSHKCQRRNGDMISFLSSWIIKSQEKKPFAERRRMNRKVAFLISKSVYLGAMHIIKSSTTTLAQNKLMKMFVSSKQSARR